MRKKKKTEKHLKIGCYLKGLHLLQGTARIAIEENLSNFQMKENILKKLSMKKIFSIDHFKFIVH